LKYFTFIVVEVVDRTGFVVYKPPQPDFVSH
jgi:hypothetical protein